MERLAVLLIEAILSFITTILLLPIVVLAGEVFAALAPTRQEVQPQNPRPSLAIVMPAHDEASLIGETVTALRTQLRASDRLLVVADNCSDRTAIIARAAGAEVIVRTDPVRRGKGYALDFGVRHLAITPPDAVLVIDADCYVDAGSIDRLARNCIRSDAPVQALYLMQAPPEAGVMVRIAEFAGLLKNLVRPLGLHRLGLPCQLMGTGMAFPWTRIRSAALASGHIVEDLKLGLELARRGAPPRFCPDARVRSFFPASREGFRSQRTRWEHGYLTVILKDAPSLLANALSTGNGMLLALALDLLVPPIALLTLLTAAVWSSNALFYGLTGRTLPLLIASTAVATLIASVLLAWARHGRRVVSLGTLALGVGYALAKIPLYAKFLVARQMDWVRSKRD